MKRTDQRLVQIGGLKTYDVTSCSIASLKRN